MLASKLNERHEWVLISLLSLAVYNQRRVPFVSSGNEEAVLWRVRDKCWILGMLVWRCMHRWHGLLCEDPFKHQTERCSCRLDWFHHHTLCLHLTSLLCRKWCHHSLPTPKATRIHGWRRVSLWRPFVSVLPPEKESVPCNFLLRLLRTAIMVRVDATYRVELENRISWQLDQASLKELMIPSFSHTCGTLLDVEFGPWWCCFA